MMDRKAHLYSTFYQTPSIEATLTRRGRILSEAEGGPLSTRWLRDRSVTLPLQENPPIYLGPRSSILISLPSSAP